MIILLNGATSAGKSSIVKELQLVFDDLFLGMNVDKFLSMVPSKYQGFGAKAKQMWCWEKSSDTNGELVKLNMGARGNSYVLGIYECVKIMAKRNFNIIVDDVCLDEKLMKQIAANLNQFKIYFVGVMCNLDILEQRERSRGNRVIGSARGQHNVVHSFYEYDVTVDTSQTSSRDCALQIKEFVENNPNPQVLKSWAAKK